MRGKPERSDLRANARSHAPRRDARIVARPPIGKLSRRAMLATLGGAGVAALGYNLALLEAEAAKSPAPAGQSLRELARKTGLEFGASIGHAAFTDEAYRDLYLKHASIVTSDLDMKLLMVRPERHVVRYEPADALVGFAQKNRMKFRGHCLVWNENNPAWLNPMSPPEVGAFMDRHIEETVTRYAGRIHSWDVVNEPLWPDHGAPGFYRKGLWHNALGPAYIERALRRAARADPKAKVVINEAFTERGDALGLKVREGLLRLIDNLQQRGAPLDAIGLEAHLQPQFAADDDGFIRFLEAIASRGLEIYLTELDIDDTSLPKEVEARDIAAAKRVGEFLDRALSLRAVKILECWQLSDRHSWYADPTMLRQRPTGDLPRPLPFDSDHKPKRMFEAIANAMVKRAKV